MGASRSRAATLSSRVATKILFSFSMGGWSGSANFPPDWKRPAILLRTAFSMPIADGAMTFHVICTEILLSRSGMLAIAVLCWRATLEAIALSTIGFAGTSSVSRAKPEDYWPAGTFRWRRINGGLPNGSAEFQKYPVAHFFGTFLPCPPGIPRYGNADS